MFTHLDYRNHDKEFQVELKKTCFLTDRILVLQICYYHYHYYYFIFVMIT
jgi:hypothetical protein